jgi:hypothetical protein
VSTTNTIIIFILYAENWVNVFPDECAFMCDLEDMPICPLCYHGVPLTRKALGDHMDMMGTCPSGPAYKKPEKPSNSALPSRKCCLSLFLLYLLGSHDFERAYKK